MRRRAAAALITPLVAMVSVATAQAPDIQEGLASFYGKGFEGKETATGTTFRKNKLTAAHPTLPGGTVVKVTNLENSKSIQVKITDRGPAKKVRREGVIIDLSRGAAKQLAFTDDGRARVRVEVVKKKHGNG